MLTFDIFLMDLESEICNFADDTTLYSCSTSLDDATIRLENDLQKLLTWFTENGMRANPSKFQMMFLGHKHANKLCLNVNGQFILQNEEVKLLGVKIDRKLTFETHVKEICTKVNQKVSTFRRVRPYLGIQKSQVLFNSVVISNFTYCPLIWVFCSKAASNKINKTHKRALRVLYDEYESTFEQLLEKSGKKRYTNRIYNSL